VNDIVTTGIEGIISGLDLAIGIVRQGICKQCWDSWQKFKLAGGPEHDCIYKLNLHTQLSERRGWFQELMKKEETV
jgi:hypothetical protein